MIQAVIYDMDGLIIDSEPLWHEVEIAGFAKVGITLNDEMCSQTTGLRSDEVVRHWFTKFGLDMALAKETEQAIDASIIPLIHEKGKAKASVRESLDFLRTRGLKLALASSSSMLIIEAVLEALSLDEYFPLRNSADSEESGKPHPAVYLTSARRLGVEPANCLAIEDSFNGAKSAKAAGMKCVAVPEDVNDPRFVIADKVIGSLALVNAELWNELN